MPRFKINGETYARYKNDYLFESENFYDSERFLADAISGVLLAYKGSELFSDVTIGNVEADRKVEIKVNGKREYDPEWKTLGRATFWIVPHKEIVEINVLTSIRDKEENTVGESEQSERVESWNSLLLFPFFPIWIFVTDHANYETLVKYAIGRTILEACEKVVF